MKNNIVLTLALLAALAFSEIDSLYGQVALRPYAGFNSSNLSEELIDNSEWKSKLGYQIGVDVQFGDKLFIQPGIQFEAFNNLKRFTLPGGGTEEIQLSTSYMRIPVLVGYRIGEEDAAFGLRVFAGPNAAFRLNGSTDDPFGDTSIEDELKGVVFGLSGGIGLDFLSIFFVDLGYQTGLTDVFEEVEGLNSGAKNNFFYGNAGIRIRF